VKNRLEKIEEQLTTQSKEIETRENKWERIEKNLSYVVNTQGERIRLNIGGSVFSTSVNTLMSIRDSFLARLVESGKINIKEEIFIDRSPSIFPFILDFYRYKVINYKKVGKANMQLLKEDADYYGITEISNYLEDRLKEPVFVKMDFNAPYVYKGITAGTNGVEDIGSKDQTKGICAASPAKIVIEMNAEWDFKEMEIGGWTGNSTIWYADNGAGAKIFSSSDKIKWTEIGKVPSGFGTKPKTIKLNKVATGKYVKFEHGSYLGIGYLRVVKLEEEED